MNNTQLEIELIEALETLFTRMDLLMGDTDLDNEDDLDVLAMQKAREVIDKARY